MIRKILFLFMPLILLAGAADQSVGQDTPEIKAYSFNLNDEVPLDSAVRTGKLDNGLTYYIRVNGKPEKRAELRLAVNAGSVLEDEDQRGLAHFVEHMAFNGTEHFEKQELVDYLESIGMQFGPDLNASTSFDQTLYKLQVPTDSLEQLKTAFQILEDWAHLLSFDTTEIDKERGVIVEEWRLGRGADARMLEKQIPIILQGSKYAERLPIGKMEIVENFEYETLKRFYHDWYRPDLMAVIAVGDFDPDMIESMIKDHFGSIPMPENPRSRKDFPIPGHRETLCAIASDPEATMSLVTLIYKLPKKEMKTVADYREDVISQIYNLIMMERLNELTRLADPPILGGFSYKGGLLSKSTDLYVLAAMVKEGGTERGLEALLREARRVKLYGFTETELERQKKQVLRMIEKDYNERDKIESNRFASYYIDNYINGSLHPGTEYDYRFCLEYIPGITLDEVNVLVDEWMLEEGRVITVNSPEKEELIIPDEQELLAIFENVESEKIEAYVDRVANKPLLEKAPHSGEIVREEYIEEIDTYHWTLSNGAVVILKPTDFKNDQILFQAFSPGGTSLVDDSNLMAGITATDIISESGLAGFDRTQLDKYLADKVVSVTPWIDSEWERLSGNASPKDLETMFKMIYLYFTQPRVDNNAYLSYKARMETMVINRGSDPQAVFGDTINWTLSQNNPRTHPWTLDLLEQMDLDKSFDIYLDRFADAGDFTFLLVGNIDIDSIKPMVKTYLGGLPSKNRVESWIDREIDYPDHNVKKEVIKGLEPKSYVRIVYYGDYDWNYQNNYDISSLAEYLNIKLREVVREDKSGTYGVGVNARTSHYPDQEYLFMISFGCDPERVDELTSTVFTQIDSLLNHGLNESYVRKVAEMQRRERERDLKENNFWINALVKFYQNGLDPRMILDYDRQINSLSVENIQSTAIKYLSPSRYAVFTLYPERESNLAK